MNAVLAVTAVLLTAAAALLLARLIAGPSLLDRTLALDVLVITAVGVMSVTAVQLRTNVSLPAMAVLALFGFTGSVCVARFAIARETSLGGPEGGGHADSGPTDGGRADGPEESR